MDDARPEQPPQADITPLDTDLTATQIEKRMAPALEEHEWLRLHGDRNMTVADRVAELRAFIDAANDMITKIRSTSFDPIPAPAPAPEPAPAPAPAVRNRSSLKKHRPPPPPPPLRRRWTRSPHRTRSPSPIRTPSRRRRPTSPSRSPTTSSNRP